MNDKANPPFDILIMGFCALAAAIVAAWKGDWLFFIFFIMAISAALYFIVQHDRWRRV